MKKLTLIAFTLIAFVLGASPADARTYKIKGEVRDQSGGYRNVIIYQQKQLVVREQERARQEELIKSLQAEIERLQAPAADD